MSEIVGRELKRWSETLEDKEIKGFRSRFI